MLPPLPDRHLHLSYPPCVVRYSPSALCVNTRQHSFSSLEQVVFCILDWNLEAQVSPSPAHIPGIERRVVNMQTLVSPVITLSLLVGSVIFLVLFAAGMDEPLPLGRSGIIESKVQVPGKS
jgi:hypothetical protein